MKKVVLALAVIATVACFSSCKKTCTCKTIANGTVVSTEEGVEKGDAKLCKDLNKSITVAGVTGSYECE